MKRFRTLIFLPLILLLVACGKSPKDEFISRVENQQTAKKAAYEYAIKLEDVTSSTEDTDAIGFQQYVGKEIKATISQDLTEHLISVSADLSVINPNLEQFELVYVDDKAYISAAPFLNMYGLTQVDAKGKYMDLAEASGQDIPKLSELTPNNAQNVDFFKEVDAKQYSKDGDKVTLTLTIDEMMEMAEKAIDQGDEKTKEAAADFKDQMESAKDAFSKDSSFTMTVDKEKKGTALLNLISKENEKDTIKIRFDFKEVEYKAPAKPASSDILTQEDLMNLIMESDSTEE